MYRNSIQNNRDNNDRWSSINNKNKNNRNNNNKINNLKNSDINNNNTINENEDITLFKHHIIDVLYDCYRLDSLLPPWIKQKITIRNDVTKLENLYVTRADANKLIEMIKEKKESEQLSPAYSMTHLKDLSPTEDGVLVKHAGREILNPRLFYLLNKQFNKLNEKYAPYSVKFSFIKESYLKSYLLYKESTKKIPDANIILNINNEFKNENKVYPIDVDFKNIITALSRGFSDVVLLKRREKQCKANLNSYKNTDKEKYFKTIDELHYLEFSIKEIDFKHEIINAINNALEDIKRQPKPIGRTERGIEFTRYRNEGALFLAIDKSCLEAEKYRDLYHIVVGVHLTRKKDKFEINLIGNNIEHTGTLHISSDNHLEL